MRSFRHSLRHSFGRQFSGSLNACCRPQGVARRRLPHAAFRWGAPVVFALASIGCALQPRSIDMSAIQSARLSLALRASEQTERDIYRYGEDDDPEEFEAKKPSKWSAAGGVALAIFPGIFVHGIGHWYAGDKTTARRLSRLGQFGYVLTAVGGGAIVGGYFLDKDDSDVLGADFTDPVAYTLYGAGGIAAGIGVTYLFSSWFYDIYDTPRAVLSGGKPPPRTDFIESLEIFD